MPEPVLRTLGRTHSERINTLVMGVVEASAGRDVVEMAPDAFEAMDQLRRYLFKNVYLSDVATTDREEATNVIRSLFAHYVATPDAMPEMYRTIDGDARTRAADYIAGMTDRYAFKLSRELAA